MQDDGSGLAFALVVIALIAFGIALPLMLAKSRVLKKAADKLPGRLEYGPLKLVRCDCGAETQCPQGRNPKAGDPYRCRIWKAE